MNFMDSWLKIMLKECRSLTPHRPKENIQGVPQRSVLGTLMFNNDLNEEMTRTAIWFSDDTTLGDTLERNKIDKIRENKKMNLKNAEFFT